MRRSSVSALAIAALLAGTLGGPATAQDKPADNMELLREKAKRTRRSWSPPCSS